MKIIFGVGADIGAPLLLLVGLAITGLLLHVCRPRADRTRSSRSRRAKGSARSYSSSSSRSKGKHMRIPTVDEEEDDLEG